MNPAQSCKVTVGSCAVCTESRLHLRNIQINLVFRSFCTTSELRSKVLALEKVQKLLAFYSLIRTFAPKFKNTYLE